jgi:putative DNA primase/helicase
VSTRPNVYAVPDAPDWRKLLALKGDRIIGDERNIVLALRHAPELIGLVRFNEFALRLEFTRSPPWRVAAADEVWREDDDTALLTWLQQHDIPVRARGSVSDAVALVAHDCPYHPVRDYLEALEWDREPRLNKWLADFLGAKTERAYLAAVGRKFLISAVARIFKPGCQVDHVLVLEGPQGIGKSATARQLASIAEWFTDDMPDIHTKDAALQLCGRWIIELAELAALRRSEIEGMKAFITRPTDVYRPPYARHAIAVPRQSVFIATTNEAHYLRDPTGNRRFWPVRCSAIDVPLLSLYINELWAEAVAAYREREVWHLTREETELAIGEQLDRVLVSELEQDVAEYLATVTTDEVTTREVLVYGLRLDPEKSDYAERAGKLGTHVASALERTGWFKVRTTGRGDSRRTIYRRPS